jgi:TolA-binding protein
MSRKLIFLSMTLFALTACEHMGIMTRNDVREQEQKVSTIQKNNADANNRFADNEAEIRALNGRIEVLENRIGQGNLDKEKSRKDLENQITELNQKMGLLQEEVSKLDNELSIMKAGQAEPAPAKSDGKASQFDMAEEYFAKKEWKKAILNYQKFRDANPKNKKVPEATYKIGVSFQELGMKEESKTFFDEVISKYPNSNEAKKSRSRLKRQ